LWDEQHLVRHGLNPRSGWERFAHFWVLVGRSFTRNRCPLRAAALSYTTLLALVPLLAVLISVSGSLLKRQGEEPIMRFIDQVVQAVTPGMETNVVVTVLPPTTGEAKNPSAPDSAAPAPATEQSVPDTGQITVSREEVAQRIKEFISNIQTGTLGVGGMIALLVLAFGLINRVDDTLNAIWGVTRRRPWHLRLAYYSAALLLGPILLTAAITLTSADHVQSARELIKTTAPWGAWLDQTFVGLMPYFILSVAFSLLYAAAPNTRVQWRAALVGGVLAGCLWQLNSQLSVFYASRVITYSRIYGSLSMVPLLMLAMYLHWLILLLGAQVSYVWQHGRTYLQDLQAENVNQRTRERLAFQIMTLAARAFHDGAPPPTIAALAEAARTSPRLVSQVVRALVAGRLLNEINGGAPAYVPARPLERITARDVLHALRDTDGFPVPLRVEETVEQKLAALAAAEEQCAATLTLAQLAIGSGTKAPRQPAPTRAGGD
jgi:membrane protein